MVFNVNILSFLYLISALPGYFLAVVYFTSKKENRKANLLFSFFLFILSTMMLQQFLKSINFFVVFPELFFIADYLYFLMGPIYYFYIRRLIDENFQFKIVHLLNFVPFVVFFLILLPYYFHSHNELVELQLQIKDIIESGSFELSDLLTATVINGFIIAYFLFSYRLISKYKENKIINLSSTPKINFESIRKTTILLIALATIEAILDLFHSYYIQEYITPILLTLLFYGIIFLGLKQKDILNNSFIGKYKSSN